MQVTPPFLMPAPRRCKRVPMAAVTVALLTRPAALIDALQSGVTSTLQPGAMAFKVNLSDAEQARAVPFIKMSGGVIEFDPRN